MGGKASKDASPEDVRAPASSVPSAIISDPKQVEQVAALVSRMASLEEENTLATFVVNTLLPAIDTKLPEVKNDPAVVKAIDALKYSREWYDFNRAAFSVLVRCNAVAGDKSKVLTGQQVHDILTAHNEAMLKVEPIGDAFLKDHYQSGPARTPVLITLNSILMEKESKK